MSIQTQVLSDLAAALSAAFQAAAVPRIVSRTFVNFGERKDADFANPVYTILGAGRPPEDLGTGYINAILVGQQLLDKSGMTPAQKLDIGPLIEDAESSMMDEIENAIDSFDGAQIEVAQVLQSAQMEKPYCWVTYKLRIGPLVLTTDADETALPAFITFHADTDMAPADGQIDISQDTGLPQ